MNYIPSFPMSHGGSPTRPHRRMTITPRSGGMVGSTGDSAWDANKNWWKMMILPTKRWVKGG